MARKGRQGRTRKWLTTGQADEAVEYMLFGDRRKPSPPPKPRTRGLRNRFLRGASIKERRAFAGDMARPFTQITAVRKGVGRQPQKGTADYVRRGNRARRVARRFR